MSITSSITSVSDSDHEPAEVLQPNSGCYQCEYPTSNNTNEIVPTSGLRL